MKKVLFLAATAAVVLSSCSNEEITNVSNVPSENGKKVIEVSAYTPGMTRFSASQTTAATLANGFSLTAGVKEDNEFTSIFNQATFTADAEGNCTASQLYYWPSNVDTEVSFYGFYPAASPCTLNVDNEKLNILLNPEDDNYAVADVIAAYAKTSASALDGGSVVLEFKHVLAQVQINVAYNADYVDGLNAQNVEFNLTSLKLTAPLSSEYDFVNKTVTVSGSNEYTFFSASQSISSVGFDAGTAMIPAASPTKVEDVITPVTECALAISYGVSINGGATKTYDKTGTVTIAAGYKNVINISLSGDKPIYVTATVDEWNTTLDPQTPEF